MTSTRETVSKTSSAISPHVAASQHTSTARVRPRKSSQTKNFHPVAEVQTAIARQVGSEECDGFAFVGLYETATAADGEFGERAGQHQNKAPYWPVHGKRLLKGTRQGSAAMPFAMKVEMSPDSTEATVAIGDGAAVKMSASELDEVIRQLGWLRASMQPAHAPVDPTPETLVSVVPAIRWYVTDDTRPRQARLFLLHLGFGWIWLPLDEEAFGRISRAVQPFLQGPRGLH